VGEDITFRKKTMDKCFSRGERHFNHVVSFFKEPFDKLEKYIAEEFFKEI
jgi:hypothetical protein